MRDRWVDISPDEHEWLIARVEALAVYVERLARENQELISELRQLTEQRCGGCVPANARSYPVPSLLVHTMSMSDQYFNGA